MTPALIRAHVEFHARTLKERGYPPSVREEAEAFGLASTSSAQDRRMALVDAGVLCEEPGSCRALTVAWSHWRFGDLSLVWKEAK